MPIICFSHLYLRNTTDINHYPSQNTHIRDDISWYTYTKWIWAIQEFEISIFKLISAFKKFYGRHKVLVDWYKVSVTHMISDCFKRHCTDHVQITCMFLWWSFMYVWVYFDICPFVPWVIYKFHWGRPYLQLEL